MERLILDETTTWRSAGCCFVERSEILMFTLTCFTRLFPQTPCSSRVFPQFLAHVMLAVVFGRNFVTTSEFTPQPFQSFSPLCLQSVDVPTVHKNLCQNGYVWVTMVIEHALFLLIAAVWVKTQLFEHCTKCPTKKTDGTQSHTCDSRRRHAVGHEIWIRGSSTTTFRPLYDKDGGIRYVSILWTRSDTTF